jgi:hypothetical protein
MGSSPISSTNQYYQYHHHDHAKGLAQCAGPYCIQVVFICAIIDVARLLCYTHIAWSTLQGRMKSNASSI